MSIIQRLQGSLSYCKIHKPCILCVAYSLRYFFTEEDENASQDYVLQVPVGEERRQVFAGYPPRDVITRSAIMQCFDDEQNKRISRMWTNIRCFEWEDLF